MEHRITLLLHIVPVNIQLGGDGIFLLLDDGEVSIGFEVVPEPMVMKLSGPIIRIFISVDH
jgi:hypothetical protein